jgi:hypothetical protein
MDTQESPKGREMKEFAGMTSAESSSIVEQLAVSLMCWRMNLSMLAYLTSMKKQLHQPLPSLQMYIISFPNNLPDIDEDESPWHDEQQEELE